MRKTKKAAAFLLSLVLLLAALSAPEPVYAAKGEEYRIPGIDYTRITEQSYGDKGGMKTFPVKLTLGDVEFKGELRGTIGITTAEMNAIIRDELGKWGLTPQKVALVSQLTDRREEDANIFLADKAIETVLSFFSLPVVGYSAADHWNQVVHENKTAGLQSVARAGVHQANVRILKKAAETPGRIGERMKSAQKFHDGGVFDFAMNGILAAVDLTNASKRMDEYLALLEENMRKVAGFYAACSRRAADQADRNGRGKGYTITFEPKEPTSYFCKFWGIDHNIMRASVKGELTKPYDESKPGPAGTYRGLLTVTMESMSLHPVGQNIEKTSGLHELNGLLQQGTFKKVVDEGPEITAKRVAVGYVTATLNGDTGKQEARFQIEFPGSFDKTEFSFSRHVVWKSVVLNQIGTTEVRFTSDSVVKTHFESNSIVQDRYGKLVGGETHSEDVEQTEDDIFKPMKGNAELVVTFPNEN